METEQVDYDIKLDKTLPGKTVLASRVLLYSVVLLIVFVGIWSSLTHVDVVVNARGRLIVQGEPLKMSAPEAGIVIEAPVRVGDHVAAGQVLLRLDPYQYDATEARLVADIDAAKADADLHQEQMQLGDSQNGEQFEQVEVAARAKVRSLQAQLSQARQARQRLTILAPVAGTITRTSTSHAGTTVSSDEPAIVLMPDNLPLLAQVRIPNASMRRLHLGEAVRVTFDAFPREDFGEAEGQLSRIDPDTDDAGFYGAWIKLDRSELRGPAGVEPLRPGLELDANILIERPSLLKLLLNPLRKLAQPLTVGQ